MPCPSSQVRSPTRELLWVGLIVLIEIQRLMYSESLILLQDTLRHN
jgi:hypothetical protein